MKGLHKNQTVIITGASSGVGEAVAHHFAANGANLVLVARNKEKLYQVKDHLRQQTNVIAIPMDVTKFEQSMGIILPTLENEIDRLIGDYNEDS